MARKWFEDQFKLVKISGTQIKLVAPTHVTIGGKQYHLTSDVLLTLTGLSANTLYYVYAVVSGGVFTLVQSTNVNSVGPTSFTAWKLVGAFYSDGLASPAFGSFVNIDGPPKSDWISTLPTLSDNTGLSAKSERWRRNSDSVEVSGRLDWSSASLGTIPFTVSIPAGSIDTTKMASTVDAYSLPNSTGIWTDSGSGTRDSHPAYRSTTTIQFIIGVGTGNLSTFGGGNSNGDIMAYGYSVPISGLSGAPLKDL